MKLSLITTLICLTAANLSAIENSFFNPSASLTNPNWAVSANWIDSSSSSSSAPAYAPGLSPTSGQGGDIATIVSAVNNLNYQNPAQPIVLGSLIVDPYNSPNQSSTLIQIARLINNSVNATLRPILSGRAPTPTVDAGSSSLSMTLNNLKFKAGSNPRDLAGIFAGQSPQSQTIDVSGTIELESPFYINLRVNRVPLPGINAVTSLRLASTIVGNGNPIFIGGNNTYTVSINGSNSDVSSWTINSATNNATTVFLNTTISSDLTIHRGNVFINNGHLTENVVLTMNGGTLNTRGTSQSVQRLVMNGGTILGSVIEVPLVRKISNAPPSIVIGPGSTFLVDEIDITTPTGTPEDPVDPSDPTPITILVDGGELLFNLLKADQHVNIDVEHNGLIGSHDIANIEITNGSNIFIHTDTTCVFENLNDETQFVCSGTGTMIFTGDEHVSILEATPSNLTFEYGESASDHTFLHQPNSILVHNQGEIIDGFGDLTILGPNNERGTLSDDGEIQPGGRTPGTLTLIANLVQSPNAIMRVTMEHRNSGQLIVKEGFVDLNGTLIMEGCQIEMPIGRQVVLIDNRSGEGIRGNFRCFVDRLSDNVMANPYLSADRHTYLAGIGASPQAGIGSAIQTINFGVTEQTLFITERTWEMRPWPASQQPLTASNEQIESGKFWEKPSNHPATIYIAPIGNWGSVDRQGTQRGFDFNSVGGLLGGDYAFERVGVGAFIGYEHSKGTIDCNYGNFRMNSLIGQAYGTFVLTNDRNLFADLSLGGARNWLTFNRQTSFAIAKGTPNGWTYDGYLGFGYNLTVKKEWRLTPILGIQYIKSHIDSFSETGSGVEDLCVNDFNKHFLRSWVGATFGGKLERSKVIWMPQIHSYWQHEFADLSRCLGVANPCIQTHKSLKIFTAQRNYGIIGADLSVIFGSNYNWTVTGAYDYLWSRKANVNNLYGKLGYNF